MGDNLHTCRHVDWLCIHTHLQGVVIKYNEPPEARKPKTRWRLYPFKGDESLRTCSNIFIVAYLSVRQLPSFHRIAATLFIHRQSAYLIGRDRRVCRWTSSSCFWLAVITLADSGSCCRPSVLLQAASSAAVQASAVPEGVRSYGQKSQVRRLRIVRVSTFSHPYE